MLTSLRSFVRKRESSGSLSHLQLRIRMAALESLVKTCKKALKGAIGDQVLTPFELYTCLMEVGNLVNQRPIGHIPNDPDDGAYLCPNEHAARASIIDSTAGTFQGNEKPKAQGRVHSTDCGLVLEALGQRCVPDTHSEEEMAHRATQCTSR